MVEQKNPDIENQKPSTGDGINRPITYAKLRTDKVAKEGGYSHEVVSKSMKPETYDDHTKMKSDEFPDCDTLIKHFDRHVKDQPDAPFLGQRPLKEDKTFGDYEWKSFKEVKEISDSIAKCIISKGLAPEVDGEAGEKRRFIGIWAKNRWEWLTTMFSGMRTGAAIVGFYDAMNQKAVDFILKQTELTTIFVENQFVKKIIDAKKGGVYSTVLNIVNYDNDTSLASEAKEQGLALYSWKDLITEGKSMTQALDYVSKKDDDYILSYTSGTTGDSKGVKLSHRNILSVVETCMTRITTTKESRLISYLPYPHSFEQCMVSVGIRTGCKIGYYQGNPLKLTEDCQVLKPTMFPSVPRLYNKIYGSIKAKMGDATGCKKWLLDKALTSKTANLNAHAVYTSGCYDKLIFNKMKALLGGCVEYMVTGSAPIDLDVLAFLKVCFCCPILEGYGLTETSGASYITDIKDPVSGHVGGPLECIKMRLRDVTHMNYLSTDKPYPRGEIQMWGASVTSGYYKNPEKTAEAFDDDGWFCSGDVGMLYPNGSLKIIDRSKNIFKLSQGEYIAPEKLENVHIMIPEVQQSFVYGDSLKNCIVAIIVLEDAAVLKWAAENEKQGSDVGILCQDKDLKKFILDSIIDIGKKKNFTSLEKPGEIHLSADPFSVENGILTTTFKLKRVEAKKAYQSQIDAMYEIIGKNEEARDKANAAKK